MCFSASRKYVFHIGLKRKPNMDRVPYSTHSGPMSALSAWPSEQNLYDFMEKLVNNSKKMKVSWYFVLVPEKYFIKRSWKICLLTILITGELDL